MASRDNLQTKKNRNFRQALGHATDGLREMFRYERNFRFEISGTLVVIIIGLILRIPITKWCWLALAIASVIITEAANTVTENLVNLLVGSHYNVLAKRIKDVAAGGVLLAGTFAAVIGILTLVPALIHWF